MYNERLDLILNNEDNQEIPLPKWVLPHRVEDYYRKREIYKASLLKTVENNPKLLAMKSVYAGDPIVTRDIYFKYNFHMDHDVAKIIEQRRMSKRNDLLDRWVSDPDAPAQCQVKGMLLISDEEDRQILTTTNHKVDEKKQIINMEVKPEDLLKMRELLDSVDRDDFDPTVINME